MTFAVGLFELFGVAIPGGLQLALVAYVLGRLGLVDLAALATAPSALLVIGTVVGSYVLGSITVPLGAVLDRVVPGRRRTADDARREFLANVPQANDRAFVSADAPLLVAAAELHDQPVASDVTRMEALSMMLRNIAFSIAAASIIAVAEVAAGPNRLLAAGCAVLLIVAVVSTSRQARRARYYSWLKTLEICFWIPDIDAKLAPTNRD